MLQKAKAFIAASVVFLFLAGAVPIQARDRDHDRDERCERQIRRAEQNLHKAIRRHGEHSRQAEQRRHDLEEARERCHRGDRDRDRDHDRDHDRR